MAKAKTKTDRVEITHRAAMARINRKLASEPNGVQLRTGRDRAGQRHYWFDNGSTQIQVRGGTTLEEIGQKEGVMRPWEVVVD